MAVCCLVVVNEWLCLCCLVVVNEWLCLCVFVLSCCGECVGRTPLVLSSESHWTVALSRHPNFPSLRP